MYYSHLYIINEIKESPLGTTKIADLSPSFPIEATYYPGVTNIQEGINVLGILVFAPSVCKIVYGYNSEYSNDQDWSMMRRDFIETISTIAARKAQRGDAELLSCLLCDSRSNITFAVDGRAAIVEDVFAAANKVLAEISRMFPNKNPNS